MKGRIKTITRHKSSDYKKQFIFDYNWFAVREVFKNEKFYLNELFNDIYNSINLLNERVSYKYGPKKNEVSLELGLSPTEKEFSFRERAIQYIKISFLKYLEKNKIIKNLKVEEDLYLNTEDNNEYPFFTSVNFLIIKNKILKEKMLYLTSKYNNEFGKIDNNRYKKLPKIINEYMIYKEKKIPFKGSEGSIMSFLLNNAMIKQDDFIIKEGLIVSRKEIQNIGGIKVKQFYETMKTIHSKIKKFNLPIIIKHPSQGHFHLIIEI